MRDEDEIQRLADKASSAINSGNVVAGVVEYDGQCHDLDYLRRVRDALDWALDEDVDEEPL